MLRRIITTSKPFKKTELKVMDGMQPGHCRSTPPRSKNLTLARNLKDRLTLSSLNILNKAIRTFNIHHIDLTL